MNTNLTKEAFRKKKIKQQRLKAVPRFLNGEEPNELCASLGCSRSWLYKWMMRSAPDHSQGVDDPSRRPLSSPFRTPAEIEKIVEMVRLRLDNKGAFCGNQAILGELIDMGFSLFLPSARSAAFYANAN
jgi:hypothetical protein